MSLYRLTIADYPLAEKRPEAVGGGRGKRLDELTLENVLNGAVILDDLTITQHALVQQAEIAQSAGRPTLSANFERAGELVAVPQETIMRIYELLRPGRARTKADLITAAEELKDRYGAVRMAAFVTEAADVYDRRGLFKQRF